MNQFEALGLAHRANAGYRVVVMTDRPEQIPGMVDQVAEQARWMTENVTVVRTKLEERVEVGGIGGEVLFTWRKSKRLDDRDYKADALFLHGGFIASGAEMDRFEAFAKQVIRR